MENPAPIDCIKVRGEDKQCILPLKSIDQKTQGVSYLDLLAEFPNACALFLPCDNGTKNTAEFRVPDSSVPLESANQLFLAFQDWDHSKEYFVDNVKVVQNSIFVRSIKDNVVAYLPIPHTKDAKSTGLPLASLIKSFPKAAGIFYIDPSTGDAVEVEVATRPESETLGSRIARDYVVLGSNGLDFSRQYFVNYKIRWDYPVGVSLSGGGFRATLFHLGALRRLNEIKMLQCVDTFSSVSGGSIINAILATAWDMLVLEDFSEAAFELFVAQPAMLLCDYNFATKVFIGDKLNPYSWFRKSTESHTSSATFLADAYTKAEKEVRLKIKNDPKNKSLWQSIKNAKFAPIEKFSQSLANALPNPNRLENSKKDVEANDFNKPLFIFCGCDMRNGRAFYFSQQTVGSDLPGQGHQHSKYDMSEDMSKKLTKTVTLAMAVAASSAFPIAFQPLLVPYTGRDGKEQVAVVTDGGVYDNIGLDPLLWPNPYLRHPFYKDQANTLAHQVVFISDAGAPFSDEKDVSITWNTKNSIRAADIMGLQSLRLRQKLMLDSFKDNVYYGAMWGLYDLWEYFSFVLTTVEQEATSATSAEALTAFMRTKEMPQRLKDRALSMVKEFPGSENYPDLLTLFGLKGNNSPNNAVSVIEKFTTFRTDLNAFSTEEKLTLEAIGYTLAAYRYRNYCSTTFKSMGSIDILHSKEFNKAKYEHYLDAKNVEKYLQYSSSVWQANVSGPFWKFLGY